MLVDIRLSCISRSLCSTPLMLGSSVLPDGLLGYERLTECVEVLLILALLVQVAGGSERRTILIQPNQAIGRSRSC